MPCPSETNLQAFVDGELSPSEIADLSAHLDTCAECCTLVGVVQPVELDEQGATDCVGRYVLRRVLGKGGMGVVYEAVDPELHRVVALKVLRSDLGALQSRLLGEAQAMAKLAHPNVVAIYDVGRTHDRVFMVMALVHGVSLRHWLAREPRSIPAILHTFEQAAEGLAAAHDAGLVHRDFKPENVLVADDGRVLVGDFGLATALLEEASEAAGSIAYMAPEQRAGEKVDARSDQYSFCLALGEAVRAGPLVPRWISKLVLRGTRAAPDDRFPSMRAVLEELRAGRTRSRRRRLSLLAILAITVFAVGGALWVGARDPSRAAACRTRAADMENIWNPAVQSRIEQAFHNTHSPLADGAWRRANAVLSEYTQAWRAAHLRMCERGRGNNPTPRTALEQKASCFTERLELVRAVTANLERIDAPMLEQVPAMLQLLPRVNVCEDAGEIALLGPPPRSDKRERFEEAKKKIAEAAAVIAAGRYKEGLALAEAARHAAHGTSSLPVLAEAYLWVGTAHGRLGHSQESQQALEHAASSASAGQAPAIAVRAWISLTHFVGFEGKRYEDGFRYAGYASAALESMPGAYELEVERLSWSRAMLLDQKRFDEALVVSRQELALATLRFGADHRLSATALDGLAGVLAGQCKTKEAIAPQEKACGILEKEYGSSHPQLALCLSNLAALHANLGEHEKALAIKQRVLDMFERMPGHPNHVAIAHRNMTRSLIELGRFTDAKSELEAAAVRSHSDADQTSILLLRGVLHRREGKTNEALSEHASAVSKSQHDDPSRRLEPVLSLAETSLSAGRYEDAARSGEEATTLARSLFGERSCRVAEPFRVHAEALLRTGRKGDALPLAERALGLFRDSDADPLAFARAEFVLAQALPASERERARILASGARGHATRDPRLVDQIDAWLAAHR